VGLHDPHGRKPSDGRTAHLNKPPAGRPDAAILETKDLGDNVFHGG